MAKRKIDHKHMSKKATDAYGKVIKDEAEPKEASEEGKFYWWRAEESEIGKQIQSTIKYIANHQSTRLEQLTASTRLYGSSSAFNFIGPGIARSITASGTANANRISFNLCSSVIDTLTSKVAKNKIIASFVTSGGVWGMQQKAEKLNKFCEGMAYELDIDSLKNYAVRDSGVWGTGVVHVFEEDDEVRVERAFPHEFFIDQIEALAGKPRQLHRVKPVDRDILLAFIETFPDGEEKDEAIEYVTSADSSSYIDISGIGTAADLIMVSESYHLKSSKESKDGLMAICVGDKAIYVDDWDEDYFPYPMLHYSAELFGAWGKGACERLQQLQSEVNRLMILVQRSMWMGGSFKILVENGSRVVSQHLNNDVGTIIFYTGTPPQYVTPPMIQQDIYPYIDSLISKAFQQEGVSQLQAAALKPEGVDSGKGLREVDNIADDRFLFFGQQVEKFVLSIYRQMIDRAKDIYARKGKFQVVFPTTTFLETIDWADIDLKRDEFVLRAYPTSSLPDEPAERLSTIQEWMQGGLVSPRAGRRLMAMPDIEMSDKLANAAEDLLHKVFEAMCNDEEYRSPEPTWDLALAGQLYVSYINYAELNNAPDSVMRDLRQFKVQLDDLNGVAAQAVQGQQAIAQLGQMQAQAQQQAAQPMANAQPTPTSPLVQNTNNPAPAA